MYGLVAQLGERTVRIREVRGFDPLQVHQNERHPPGCFFVLCGSLNSDKVYFAKFPIDLFLSNRRKSHFKSVNFLCKSVIDSILLE